MPKEPYEGIEEEFIPLRIGVGVGYARASSIVAFWEGANNSQILIGGRVIDCMDSVSSLCDALDVEPLKE